jgi:hypothetical protein
MGGATFGEFLRSAHRHLTETAAPLAGRCAGGSVEEVPRSLLREVAIMGRYLDITTTFHNLPARSLSNRK